MLKKGDDGYRRYDKPVADVFNLDGFYTNKAYYILENEDKKLGDTGSTNFFEGNYKLEMYPSESVVLNYSLDSFFKNDTLLSSGGLVNVYTGTSIINSCNMQIVFWI